MLELKNIIKTYTLGKPGDSNYQCVEALKGVSIQFRDTEFVSILGPSGCGKTTLLNIIGGLDHYTDGDLIINNVSTKDYKDSDWDNYRNHKIGFVFQSYNLIPHQTVLENVELALTLSGVNKEERKTRAKEALEKVGLGDKINAKPTQLSGGQMQRVAIARAIVNNPDIILADEPTGALDTKTSIQVMELLKEISKEKLIIMVTHNPELAKKYSTRIVELLDGRIMNDSSEFNVKDAPKTSLVEEKPKTNKEKKTSMSFWTALSLSGKNLLTKKGRTALVSFAGSIGIIGIALILSLSSGFQNYIDTVQQDTLSTYPLTITTESLNYTSALEAIMNPPSSEIEGNDSSIGANEIMSNIFDSVMSSSSVNNLKNLKSYIDNDPAFQEFIIQYAYNLNIDIYSQDGTQLEPMTVFTDLIRLIGEEYNAKYPDAPIDYESYITRFTLLNTSVFSEMIDSMDLIKGQYDLIGEEYGSRWPSNYDEAILVVNDNYTINDYYLYALDIVDEPSLNDIAHGLLENFENQNNPDYNKYEVEIPDVPMEKILGKEYRIFSSSDYYKENDNGTFSDIRTLSNADELIKENIEDSSKGVNLKIVGVVRPNKNASAHSISTPVAYLPSLTREIANRNANSPVVIAQKTTPDINVLTGKPFSHELTVQEKKQELTNYFTNLTDAEVSAILIGNPDLVILLDKYGIDTSDEQAVRNAFLMMISMLTSDDDINAFYNQVFSASSYEDNMKAFGVIDLANPSSISFYCNDFESKERLIKLLDQYNDEMRADPNKGESYVITYTDYAGIMIDSISVIINAISYVLIAFVSVSLIVSSIMIGIITYISVLERTKEIGVLRAIGASKKDIKHVFTAESLIIGLISGALGLVITIVLDIPISLIINHLAGIANVAVLPWGGALILLVLSCLLTFIAGLIPARIASKKDPVDCLRSE